MRLKLELCKPKSFDSQAEGKSFYAPATWNELEKLLQYGSSVGFGSVRFSSTAVYGADDRVGGAVTYVVVGVVVVVASLHSFLIIDIQ